MHFIHCISDGWIFHYQTFIAHQLQKKTNQKLTKDLEAGGATPAGSQPPQTKQGNLTGDTRKTVTTTAKSSPANKFLPLQTTPELYTTLTGVFLDKPLVYNPQEGMVFDPPTSPEYTPHIEALKVCGRMINITTADGNCMFRSLSKGLLGAEKYHYRIRTILFGFIYGNSKIFLPHIEQKYNCSVEIREYCVSMDKSGIWGTEIELLAAATMLQAPVYTYTQMGSTGTYQWSKFHSLAPPTNIYCDYDAGVNKLVNMPKPSDWHIELLHFGWCHYDLIVAMNQENRLNFPPLSKFSSKINLCD